MQKVFKINFHYFSYPICCIMCQNDMELENHSVVIQKIRSHSVKLTVSKNQTLMGIGYIINQDTFFLIFSLPMSLMTTGKKDLECVRGCCFLCSHVPFFRVTNDKNMCTGTWSCSQTTLPTEVVRVLMHLKCVLGVRYKQKFEFVWRTAVSNALEYCPVTFILETWNRLKTMSNKSKHHLHNF